MSFIIDTNILSEGMRAKPSARVAAWLQSIPTADQYFSTLSVGEIRYGLARMNSGQRRDTLLHWLEHDLKLKHQSRILPVTLGVAERWGRLKWEARRTLPVADSLIAATALHHGFTLATRNTKDFSGLGLKLVDPFA